MTKPQYGLWLGEQVGSALLYFWPVSIITIALFAAAQVGVPVHLMSRRLRLLVMVACFFGVPLVFLAVGTAFSVPAGSYSDDTVGEVILNVAGLIALAAAVAIVGFSGSGLRLRAAAMLLFPLWLAACALFVSGMAVSGDWL